MRKKQIIQAIIDREGGYCDHPDDRGGPTKYGITAQTAAQNVLDAGPDLFVDGHIGPATINKLFSYLGHREEDVLIRAVNGLQVAFYIALSENKPSQRAFTYGWIRHRC